MSSGAFVNSDQMYGTKSARISGGVVGVTNGPGVFFTANVAIISGVGASGIIYVYDAPSGAGSPVSGSLAPILFFVSGAAAGATYAPQPFFSGLNVSIVSGIGYAVTVTYRNGI